MNQRKSGALWIGIFSMAASITNVATAAAPLTITSPINGASVTSGQSLVITVTVASGTYPHGIAVIGQHPLGVTGLQAVAGSTLRFTLAIPANTPPGSYNLTAMSVDSKGVLVPSAPVSVIVERADLPTMLATDPLIFFAYVGQTLPWTIFSTFAGGVQTDVTQSTLLNIDSGNTRVAIVEHGLVKAMGSGKTNINVRYGSITKSIAVTVPAFVRGDLNGDGRVDESDLNVLLDAIGTRANSANDARDLNHDGVIDVLDVEILKSLCTHPACASQ